LNFGAHVAPEHDVVVARTPIDIDIFAHLDSGLLD
jgi:hypothetical protein